MGADADAGGGHVAVGQVAGEFGQAGGVAFAAVGAAVGEQDDVAGFEAVVVHGAGGVAGAGEPAFGEVGGAAGLYGLYGLGREFAAAGVHGHGVDDDLDLVVVGDD